MVGAATGRGEAAGRLVDDFNAYAARAGAEQDAAHFQASIVQLTENSLRIYGADNFAASVMIDFGVDRPQAQRFTDKPYVEVGTSDLDTADFRAADGDIVYLSFTSAKAKERAPEILYSDAWRQLSATRDNRVFAVNNEIWHLGQGIVAARAVVTDLRWVNAAIN